jgi:conjugative transfer region protein (TIGR03750 family)
VPDKVNERPTIWKGLTLRELVRLGLTGFLISLCGCEMLLMLVMPSTAGVILGFLAAILITIAIIFIGAHVIAVRKVGKPYGYSDQQFDLFKAKWFPVKKIPCVVTSSIWSNKRIVRRSSTYSSSPSSRNNKNNQENQENIKGA